MGKVTLVVDFPDGKVPAVGANTEVLGGRLCSVAWSDVTVFPWRNNEVEPPKGTPLLVTTTDGYVEVDTYTAGGWFGNTGEVVAWAFLPDPYSGGMG